MSPSSQSTVPASPLWRLFTWEEPLSSGTGLAFGLSAFLAHTLGYTLAGVVVQLALAALVISAGTALYSAMMEGAALPQPRIALHADALRRASSVAGERAVAALERINELLAWRDVAASGRALAYAWFAYRTIWLLAPHRLVAAWILAFALAPVYVIFSLPINAALALHVTPQVVALQVRTRAWACGEGEGGGDATGECAVGVGSR